MKKIITLLLLLSLCFGNWPVALAQEAPSAPSAPSSPISPNTPSAPDTPSSPSFAGSHPNPPSFPQPTPTVNETPTPTRTPRATPTANPSEPTDSSLPTPEPQRGAKVEAGETRVVSGNATSDATLITTGNNNGSINHGGGNGNTSFSTNGNGAYSTNDTSMHIADHSNTIQDNSVALNTNLNQNANTGENNSSGNVGDTYVKTGDANVSGTVITSVNTNIDGVMVSEFTIADDHRGDIILDFGHNCISGCKSAGANVKTAGNAANSTSTTTIDTFSSDAIFQNNDAAIGNELTLNANSGYNSANYNTGGESIIYTGDANVSANVLTFANNNIQGNVFYGVVNIYGNLIGDIIFPEEQLAMLCCGAQDVTVNTSNNGANSVNSTNIHTASADQTFQSNDAIIQNNLALDAQTGNNAAVGNTSGDNRVITGNANIDTNVINVANSNIDGGNMWLVIINEAGKWIGKILGGNGSNMAASEGTMLSTDAQGNVIVTNANGANSTNVTTVNNSSHSTTTQNNTVNIQNTLNLSANTGGNESNYNTGGNSSVVTGNANIIANMVNFVNNNITGNGKLFVTVVNVFGSWLGDFLLPGQRKQSNDPAIQITEKTVEHIGGANVSVSNQKTQIEQSIDKSGEGVNTIIVQNQSPAPATRQTFRKILGTSITNTQKEEAIVKNDEENMFDVPQATITPVVAGKNVVRINLAWLIFLIPGAILFFILRMTTRKLKQRLP
jgi:hypothetical protein